MLNEVGGRNFTNSASTMRDLPPTQGGTGKLIGKAMVQVISPQSVLQDAMEELSFQFNKSDDFALKNRKERNQADRFKDRLKAFRKIADEATPDADEKLMHSLEEGKEKPDTILEEVLEQYKEPAAAWAALDRAREKLAKQPGKGEIIKQIDNAIALLDKRYGAAIRAGICGTLTAAQNYVSLGDVQDLGATYRKSVLEFTKVVDLYSYIESKYGKNFDKAIEFLYNSLSADLACDEPSSDKVTLERANQNLGKLRVFQSAHSICDKQMNRWENVYNIKNANMNGLELLGKILKLGQENFIGSSEVNYIVDNSNPPDIEHRIYFLQELLNNLRSFSPLVFDEPAGRERVIEAVQGCVDKVVEEEDAMLQQQE